VPEGPCPRPEARACDVQKPQARELAVSRRRQKVERAILRQQAREDAEPTPTQQAKQRRAQAWATQHRQRFLRRHGGQEAPPTIPREVWVQAQLIVSDGTGRMARQCLEQEKNKVWAGAARNAALAPLQDGVTRYDWTDTRARQILGVGYVLRSCARVVGDRYRKGWGLMTRGLNRCALLLAVRDPNGGDPLCKRCGHHHPSFSALSGRHRKDATLQTGQVGWLVALEEAGAIERQQFKHPEAIERCCQEWELGEAGYPCTWYRMPSAITHPKRLTVQQLLMHRALHALGCDAPDEVIMRRVSFVRAPLAAGVHEARPP
jgi:hypothetical protein